MFKRKLKIQIRADEWAGEDVNEEIELPKRVWSGRNSGIMFKVLFVDPRNEYAEQGQGQGQGVRPQQVAGTKIVDDAHKLG
jgi:hypothetical protein